MMHVCKVDVLPEYILICNLLKSTWLSNHAVCELGLYIQENIVVVAQMIVS